MNDNVDTPGPNVDTPGRIAHAVAALGAGSLSEAGIRQHVAPLFSRVLDAALGMPTIADLARPEWDRPASSKSKISMIVPARNEEEMIGKTLPTMLRQDYQNYEVIAIDDRSTDRTGEIIDRIASSHTAGQDGPSLKVIHISELPTDWMGKPHAMWVGAQQATGDWLLFTDADITFSPDCLRRAVAYAEESKTDHLVLIPTLIMLSVGERMMLAFFNILFVFGHRPWKVADPRTKDHMGVGAFNLIRRTVYDQVGTHAKLRFEVLDDVKLGKIVKENGFTQRVALGRNLISLRWAKNAMDVVRTDGPLWQHTAWLAIGEIVFGLIMIGAGVVPGGARGLMTFMGILAVAFGIAVLVAPNDLRAENATGWAFIIAGGVSLLAAAISPVFFTGDRRYGYARRREVTA